MKILDSSAIRHIHLVHSRSWAGIGSSSEKSRCIRLDKSIDYDLMKLISHNSLDIELIYTKFLTMDHSCSLSFLQSNFHRIPHISRARLTNFLKHRVSSGFFNQKISFEARIFKSGTHE
ncbi:hypothetical protein BpHYR1_048601 [Brachionus plicatilis]|uniref:Uncharacterized protein n=1 Tax=Brachionus plicatilis TaxID=10195 RepID=A0A3M7STJ6_BRAPC|nr:hypothetical protein BpHYR1_048601 [Brachionus plicatilis]